MSLLLLKLCITTVLLYELPLHLTRQVHLTAQRNVACENNCAVAARLLPVPAQWVHGQSRVFPVAEARAPRMASTPLFARPRSVRRTDAAVLLCRAAAHSDRLNRHSHHTLCRAYPSPAPQLKHSVYHIGRTSLPSILHCNNVHFMFGQT